MRRFIAILLMCLICCTCSAEIPCICDSQQCVCFIQLGDGGPEIEYIQHALIAQGFLNHSDDVRLFDDNTHQAVLRFQEAKGLPQTGLLDDDTLTLLLWGMLPEELDIREPESKGSPIWVPTDGGIRRHSNPGCCAMYDPRLVSIRNAQLMNMLPCGICNREGKHE